MRDDSGLEGEQRPQDAAKEIAGTTAEAAELLEHIRDTDPQWKREELLDKVIEMVDSAHTLAVRTELELKE